jgi:hypothetical protein
MSWQRLESSTVGADLLEGLEARIADPLWALARQWQVGELHGEDAASPIFIKTRVEYAPITRLRMGSADDGTVLSRAEVDAPLETLVEREVPGPGRLRLSADAGMALLRALAAAGAPKETRARLRQRYSFVVPDDDATSQLLALDEVGRAELALLERRAIDGAALLHDLEVGTPDLPSLPTPLKRVLERWRVRYADLVSKPTEDEATSWTSRRMEYRLAVAAPASGGEVQLEAHEYAGGHLDWYAFDVADDRAPLDPTGQTRSLTLEVLPVPVRYSGMPAPRWWAFEDGEVSWGDVTSAPEDLARAVVTGFATVYGDDWFLVPVRLPVGGLARVTTLEITDDFGQTTRIRSCAERDGPQRAWRFFELTGDDSANADELANRSCPWLFLPPVLAGSQNGRPLETVLLARDEASNLAWAIERTVESPSGRRIDRQAAWHAGAAERQRPGATDAGWRYMLGHEVPDHQVPLLPVKDSGSGALYLQRGRVATSSTDAGVTTRGALGHILEPTQSLFIHEDEVPSTGARIIRHYQLARDPSGRPHLWIGRRKGPPPPIHERGVTFDQLIRETDDGSTP